jgi:hypothetical protein
MIMFEPFFEDTKARNIDYCVLNGRNFVYLAGLDMPAIYMVNNSIVENYGLITCSPRSN